MLLPEEITTATVREISDMVDDENQLLLDEVEDAMADYIAAVVVRITKKFKLDDDQMDELMERLAWRLELV